MREKTIKGKDMYGVIAEPILCLHMERESYQLAHDCHNTVQITGNQVFMKRGQCTFFIRVFCTGKVQK